MDLRPALAQQLALTRTPNLRVALQPPLALPRRRKEPHLPAPVVFSSTAASPEPLLRKEPHLPALVVSNSTVVSPEPLRRREQRLSSPVTSNSTVVNLADRLPHQGKKLAQPRLQPSLSTSQAKSQPELFSGPQRLAASTLQA